MHKKFAISATGYIIFYFEGVKYFLESHKRCIFAILNALSLLYF